MRALLVAALAATLSACASTPTSALVYPTYGAQQAGSAAAGFIVDLRPVTIRGQDRNEAWLGGAVGGAAGFALTRHSSGSTEALGSILGGVAGVAAGQALSQRSRPGVEVVVAVEQYGRQRVISVVQDADQQLRVGEPVWVIQGRGTRVVPRSTP